MKGSIVVDDVRFDAITKELTRFCSSYGPDDAPTALRQVYSHYQVACTLARYLKPHPRPPRATALCPPSLDEYKASELLVQLLSSSNDVKTLNLEDFFGEQYGNVVQKHDHLKATSKATNARNAESFALYAHLTAVELPDDGPSDRPSLRGFFLPMSAVAAKRVIPKRERGSEKHTAEER